MKTVTKLAILVSVLFLAVAACDSISPREAAEAAREAREAIAIAPEQSRINGLHIGSGEAEITAAFGPPSRIEENFDEVESKPSRTLYYDGIKIYLVGGEIYGLECRAPVCATADGVRVGDPADKVAAVLGPGRPGQRDDGSEVLRYPVANADVALIVDFRDGRVIALTLFFDYT